MLLNNKKGAVLIMTLMALVLVFMMVHALMQTTGIGLQNSGSFYDRESALQAAQSGLDYAVTRLQSNRDWRGDANRAYWTCNHSFPQGGLSSGFLVSENNGNVVGLIVSKAKIRSAFRIKFSFEDTSEATLSKVPAARFADYDQPEPTTSLPIAMPFVSVNNLRSEASVLVYRANPNGKGVAEETDNLEWGDGADAQRRPFANHLPGQRAMIIVEGLSGKGLRDCNTPEEVNKLANSASAATPLVRRYVESYYTFNAPVLNGNAAFAEENIDITVANKMFVRSFGNSVADADDKSTIPAAGSLRSNTATITVNGGTLNTYNGKLYRPDGKATAFNNDTTRYKFLDSTGKEKEYTFTTTVEDITAGVDPIEYDQVAHAQNNSKNALLPGFYEWHAAANSTAEKPTYELRYYGDVSASDKNKPANDATYKVVRVSARVSDGSEEGSGSQPQPEDEPETDNYVEMGPEGKIVFTTDADGNITAPVLELKGQLFCDGSLTIASATGEVTAACPAVLFDYYAPGETATTDASCQEAAVLQSGGNITILGAVKGKGAVVTQEGDVTFCGESVLENSDNGVAVYANNVYLNPLTVALAKAPGGRELNENQTGSASGGGGGDTSDTFTPSRSKINQICNSNSGSSSSCKSKRKALLEELFASEYGARISVTDSFKNTSDDYWSFTFSFVNSQGTAVGKKYSIHSYIGRNRFTMHPLGGSYQTVTSLTTPGSAKVSDGGGTGVEVKESLKPVVEACGDLCYGDQEFKGIIYARNDIKVLLGEQFKFVVFGSLRAEKGAIIATCKDSMLTYDESNLETLMPNMCRLNRVFWTCW